MGWGGVGLAIESGGLVPVVPIGPIVGPLSNLLLTHKVAEFGLALQFAFELSLLLLHLRVVVGE